MPSLLSRLAALYIKKTRARHWASAEAVRQSIAVRDSHQPPQTLQRVARFSEHRLIGQDWPYYVISGRHSDHVVFYFHGGGYIHEIAPQHYAFALKLSNQLDCKVVIPIYPLAPLHKYTTILGWCDAVVTRESSKTDKVSFVGDSAGGGLALGLAMRRRHMKKSLPDHLGLISPALDATMANPAAATIDDPWLSIDGIREAGRMYGGDDVSHPYVSPIFGELGGLPPISTLIGTRDIFYPDCLELAQRAEQHHPKSALRVGQGMIHVWPLLPIPEAAPARQWLVDQIRSAWGE